LEQAVHVERGLVGGREAEARERVERIGESSTSRRGSVIREPCEERLRDRVGSEVGGQLEHVDRERRGDGRGLDRRSPRRRDGLRVADLGVAGEQLARG
jgi:hypothetical protein